MTRYVLVGLLSGALWGAMDGILSANSLAQRLFLVYRPIARSSVTATAGIVIHLAYGLVMAWMFLLLYGALPGRGGLEKGMSFALLGWFFRVVMGTVGQWMIINIPVETAVYLLLIGLVEMLVVGVLYGLTLRPSTWPHKEPS